MLINKCLNCGNNCKNKYCNNKCSNADISNKKRLEYEKNPNICLTYGNKISYEKRNQQIIYCSIFCAVSKDNKLITEITYVKNKICLKCKKIIKSNYNSKKFCSKECNKEYTQEKRIDELINGKISCANSIRKYLLIIKAHKCEICNLSTWNNKLIPLEVDHIDGNYSNNYLENLRLLCPNCHAQTDTYKSKNNGNGRHKRRDRYKQGKSF